MKHRTTPDQNRRKTARPGGHEGMKGDHIMKHICITYHMTKPNEVAETCTTIALDDPIADDLLQHQATSAYVQGHKRFTRLSIPALLSQLAALQGYDRATFCCAEETTLT